MYASVKFRVSYLSGFHPGALCSAMKTRPGRKLFICLVSLERLVADQQTEAFDFF